MKKRLLSILLALCMALTLLPGVALAEETDPVMPLAEEGIVAEGTCGAEGNNLTWTLYDDGTLIISGEGEMMDFVQSVSDSNLSFAAHPWVRSGSNYPPIKKIIINDGVTSIGSGAFSDHINVTDVTIPYSVTDIGEYAFHSCYDLSDVHYSGTKEQWCKINFGTEVDFWAAANALHDAIIHCEDGNIIAFGECGGQGNNLTWMLEDDGILNISGEGAMPDYAQKTGDYETSISVRPWGNNNYDTLTKKIIINDGVTNIGSGAFYGFEGLTDVIISDSVESIGDIAFEYCESLRSIEIPKSVTSIGESAFERCTSLASITLQEGVTSIGERAFEKCTSLSNITLPESLTNIGDYTFIDCTSLRNITIPGDITKIGTLMFYNCTNLSSITLPESVYFIDSFAFDGCDSLFDVYYSGTEKQWEDIDISPTGNENLAKANKHFLGEETTGNTLTWSLKDGVLTISGEGPMDDYTIFTEARSTGHPQPFSNGARIAAPWYSRGNEIQKIVIGEGITSIGDAAFNGLSNVTSVTIPDSVISIGNAAFDGCSALPSIRVPKNVKEIGTYAFGCGHSLKEILVDEANQSFCSVDGVLYNKEKTKLVQFPAGLDRMYRILSGTKVIGTWAFDGSLELQALVIPVSVTSIENYAFSGCMSLEDVYYPGSESEWEKIEGTGELEWLSTAIHFNSNGDYWLPKGQMPDAIKNVPYEYRTERDFSIVSSDYLGWLNCYYERVPGSVLPSGLILDRETGVISGVPQAPVTGYEFAIRRVLSYEDGEDIVEELKYTLNVLDNSDSAVKQPNIFEITTYVGVEDPNKPNHFLKNSYTKEEMKIEGPFKDFVALYIDGEKLTPGEGEDYTARNGSVVITIQAQTFQRFKEGTHTISAEFREDRNPNTTMKMVSQNYTLTLPRTNSGGGGGSSASSKTSVKTPQTTQTPQEPQETVPPFTDINASDWFYQDLVWAYENGLMVGYADGTFQPQRSISQATIVTVLARMAKIDLSKFTGEEEDGIAAGQQFTEAAIWAKRSGLLPEQGTFTGDETTTRNQMAVMLVKYLQSMGKDVTPPETPVVFTDAADMSPEGIDAFQVLYSKGIFRGTGGLNMNPAGSTTRAHFVALIHRIYDAAMSDD